MVSWTLLQRARLAHSLRLRMLLRAADLTGQWKQVSLESFESFERALIEP